MKISTYTDLKTQSIPAVSMGHGDVAIVETVLDQIYPRQELIGTVLIRHYKGFTGFKAGENIPRYWDANDMTQDVFVRPLKCGESITIEA